MGGRIFLFLLVVGRKSFRAAVSNGLADHAGLRYVLFNHSLPIVVTYFYRAFKKSVRKALFAALEGEEDYFEAPNLLSKINLYFT